MTASDLSSAEQQRLAALRRYAMVETSAEPDFDDITQLARDLFDMPVALIGLIDDRRQWFLACRGADWTEILRESSLCRVTIERPDTVTVIEDTRHDPRTHDNPLVTGPPDIGFYAGAPLVTPDGHAIGTLCVLDRGPRSFESRERASLQRLARQAMALLERRREHAVLREVQALNEQIVGHAPVGLTLYDESGHCIAANDAMARLIGATREQVLAQNFMTLKTWREQGMLDAALHCLRTGELRRVTALMRSSFGRVSWFSASFVRLQTGEHTRLMLALSDLTDVKQAELRYQKLFEHTLDGVLQTRPGGEVLSANPAACTMLGMTEAEICARGRAGLLDLDDPRLPPLLAARERDGFARGELRMRRGDGTLFEVEMTSTLYEDSEGQMFSSIVFRDMTERKQNEARTLQLAYYDALTGLPNRVLLQDRMEQALSHAHRVGQHGAAMFLDLDHFKHINDARGHAVGDQVLRKMAGRLRAMLRGEDTVARLGGDEFVLLITELGTDTDSAARAAMATAEKVRAAVEIPYEIDGQIYNTSCSVGITLFPKGVQTTDDLLREADTAMYRAKAAGRNGIAFFERTMQLEVEERLGLEQDLKRAIHRRELQLFVQGQVDAEGRTVAGEALLRWHHPEHGPVSPTRFIPLAEESGLIHEIGDWVIEEACHILARLRDAGRPQTLSVNVSPRQFRQDDFVHRVRSILNRTTAPADRLIFEVTESLFIHDWRKVQQRMTELSQLGIRFSIDDFGTGYSSLAYLQRLPLSEVKIDRSFIAQVPDDAGATAITRSILSMSRTLGLEVVAEGVETAEQADFLRQHGCERQQGYLFSQPCPADEWLVGLGPLPAG